MTASKSLFNLSLRPERRKKTESFRTSLKGKDQERPLTERARPRATSSTRTTAQKNPTKHPSYKIQVHGTNNVSLHRVCLHPLKMPCRTSGCHRPLSRSRRWLLRARRSSTRRARASPEEGLSAILRTVASATITPASTIKINTNIVTIEAHQTCLLLKV